MTRPSDSGASGVDWSGELEAVNSETGEVVQLELRPQVAFGGTTPDKDGDVWTTCLPGYPGNAMAWCKPAFMRGSWRIRNAQPQPADTVTVGRELHERMSRLLRRQVDKLSGTMNVTDDVKEARAIVAQLEPLPPTKLDRAAVALPELRREDISRVIAWLEADNA